jgi:hypothetical protein
MAQLVPRSLDWIVTAPVVISESREMPVSAAAAFAVVADHERWPEWFTSLKRVELTGAPTGVGGQRRVHVRGASIDEEFIGWETDRLFAFTITHASRPIARSMAESVRVEPLGDSRCRVTYTQAIEPHRWMTPMFAVARRPVGKMLRGALEGLERAASSRPG